MSDANTSPDHTRDGYTPVNCDFHDVLTSRATLRQKSILTFRDGDEERTVTDVIEDVYTKGDEEFVRLRGGEVIRLDRFVRIADT